MDAIIGRYKVHIEETELIITHPMKINFTLTPEEALGLFDFISIYRQSLLAVRCNSAPSGEEMTIDQENKRDEQPQPTVIRLRQQ